MVDGPKVDVWTCATAGVALLGGTTLRPRPASASRWRHRTNGIPPLGCAERGESWCVNLTQRRCLQPALPFLTVCRPCGRRRGRIRQEVALGLHGLCPRPGQRARLRAAAGAGPTTPHWGAALDDLSVRRDRATPRHWAKSIRSLASSSTRQATTGQNGATDPRRMIGISCSGGGNGARRQAIKPFGPTVTLPEELWPRNCRE